MTFLEFKKFVVAIINMSGEDPINFVIMKDLFNYIDIKRDGFIDLHEWLQTFKRIEVS